MSNKYIYIVIFILKISNLYSQNISPQIAYSKAVDFFEFKSNDTIPVSTKSYNVIPIAKNDTTFMYVVEIADVGWSLISSYSLAGPYFAYSMEDNFDLSEMLPATEMWFEYFKNITRHCKHNPEDSSFFQEDFVLKLNQKHISAGSFNLIRTKWSQKPPYNNFVNDNGRGLNNNCFNNNKCEAGCGAIAMAQIMRYWVHPFKTYDWCNMPEKIDMLSPLIEQNAVAVLIRDIGEKVDMEYCVSTSCISGTLAMNIINSFRNDFDFNNQIELKEKRSFTNEEWKDMLREELNNHRPIYYQGTKMNGGLIAHAFICDGYDFDNNDFFHFNWGNGGLNDGFYAFFSNNVPSIVNFTGSQAAALPIFPASSRTCDGTHIIYEYYRYLPFHYLSSYLFPIASTISTAHYPNNVSIQQNETAIFKAYNTIILEDFTVEAGANFTAQIIPCPFECMFQIMYYDKSMLYSDKPDNNSNIQKKTTYSDHENEHLIKVYPNPFSDFLTIETFSEVIESVEVFDFLGRSIYTKNNPTGLLDLYFLNNGIYLLRISVNNVTVNKTIIKQ